MLLEREAELRLIDEAISNAGGAIGHTVLIQGPAGIGKTILLRATRDRAEAADFRVLAATGRQLEHGFPFGVARQLFEPVLRSLDRSGREEVLAGAAAPATALLGAAPDAAPPGDVSFAVAHGIYWLTANLAERQPLLLAVDDLHWADAPSQEALAYLVPRLAELPALLAATARSREPGATDVRSLLPEGGPVEILRPAPLSPVAVAGVVRAAVGSEVSQAFCDACHRATGGNPFLARELALAAAEEGLVGEGTEAARVSSLAPASVSRSALPRIRRLGAEAASLARALAVLERAELHVAAALAGLDDEQAAAAAEALTDAGIVARGLPLRFVHPVLRATVYEDVSPASREGDHRRAAALLAKQEGDPLAAASHLAYSEPRGEAWATAALRSAGRDALARGSPEAAARMLRRAVDEGAPDERAELLHELARAEAASGDPRATERLAAALQVGDDPDIRAQILATLAEARFIGGDFAASVDTIREALDELASRPGTPLEVQLFLGYVMLARVYAPIARDASERIRRRQPAADGSLAEQARLAGVALDGFLTGEPAERVRDAASAALQGASLLDAGGSAVDAFHLATWALAGADDFAGAETALLDAFERARRSGSYLAFAVACHFRLWSRWRRGQILGTLADTEIALDLAERGWELSRAPAAWARAECLIETGDASGATEALEEAERLAPGLTGSIVEAWPAMGRSRLELERDDPGRALEEALRAGSLLTALHAESPAVADWRSRAAIASAALGDGDRARELWEEKLRLARAVGAPRAIGIALRAAGLIEGGDRGIALLREAAETLAESPALLERARVLVDLGATLRRARQRREAREPLRWGLQLAGEVGATALADRAHDELLATGARPRREAVAGPEALTARELRIAELAAQGLGNREIAESLFITRKTVEAHLRSIFRKVEIKSRSEIPDALGGR